MDTSARSVGGGLLAGLGKGLQARSEREHEDMMLAKKEALEDARQLRQQEFLAADRTADRNERFGEQTANISERAAERQATLQERQGERADRIASDTANRTERAAERKADAAQRDSETVATIQGDDGKYYRVPRKGAPVDTGVTGAKKGAALDENGMTPAEARDFGVAKTLYVTRDALGGTKVDPKGLSRYMRERGHVDIADSIDGKAAGESGGGSTAKGTSGLPDGIPDGSQLIGYSKGKPVYQTSDGKKLVAE